MATLTFGQALLGELLTGCTTSPKVPAAYSASPSSKGQLLFGLRTREKKAGLRVFDWDTYRFDDFPVPLDLVHSVTRDTHDRNVVYLFEVFGSGVRLDLASNSIVAVKAGTDDRMFNGHGAVSSSGEFVACTEMNSAKHSTVMMRSTRDFSPVAELPEACRSCHQIVALPNSSLFVTGNMRRPFGGFTFYDTASRRVLNVVDTPHPILHLMPVSSTEVIGISLPRPPGTQKVALARADRDAKDNLLAVIENQALIPGPLYLASIDGKVKTLWPEEQKKIFTGILGMAKASKTRFLSSHHDSNVIAVWDDFEIRRLIPVSKPTSLQISKDGSEFIVIADGKVVIYSMTTFEPIKALEDWPTAVALSTYS
jgi:hypothetical protein